MTSSDDLILHAQLKTGVQEIFNQAKKADQVKKFAYRRNLRDEILFRLKYHNQKF